MELKKYNANHTKVLKINQIVRTVSETHRFDKDKLIAINTSDVENGVMGSGTLTSVDELKGQFKKTIVKDDILFSEIRPANRRFAKVTTEDTKDYVVSTKLMVLRKYNEDVDLEYFYYCLTNQPFLDILQRRAENRIGSFPQITFDLLSEYAFPIPPISEQKRISSVISTLDKKIALNRAINQNLEAMAKQLYDYWFVQFDFPNKDGKPYKSSGGEMVWNEKLKRMIPKEWTNANIYQLASISKETVNPQAQPNELFKHYSLPEYDKTGTYAEEYGIDIQSAKFIVTNNCILVSKLNPWTSRVICGNRGSNQICSTEFVVWNPASLKTKGFLFMLAKSAKFIEYCTQGATGTSHSHRRINPELMMKFDFPYNSEIAIKFSLLIENIIVHLHNNIAQLKVLTKQRDELLPLLMNGQITIE
ncbi:restriction endonuclease subunit S [Bacteroides fragilis]|mgnify:CR=1 FL=1|uniref:restriction endonuclease subunit S n=4 Tax=Bacteroides TaxID=816 RepID=UPI0004D37DC7|nr:restriction endonuclease subunit S [Bacteroides fragilis]